MGLVASASRPEMPIKSTTRPLGLSSKIPVHLAMALHQVVALHDFVHVHEYVRRGIEASQPHIPHDDHFQRIIRIAESLLNSLHGFFGACGGSTLPGPCRDCWSHDHGYLRHPSGAVSASFFTQLRRLIHTIIAFPSRAVVPGLKMCPECLWPPFLPGLRLRRHLQWLPRHPCIVFFTLGDLFQLFQEFFPDVPAVPFWAHSDGHCGTVFNRLFDI